MPLIGHLYSITSERKLFYSWAPTRNSSGGKQQPSAALLQYPCSGPITSHSEQHPISGVFDEAWFTHNGTGVNIGWN